MTKARNMMSVARSKLVLDEPFFGMLALRLKLEEDPTCKTAWVDGTTLGYNPAFVESLSLDELVALTTHEVMHCAAGHPWRRGTRPIKRWNEACDRAINPMLREHGFKLPEGALFELEPSHRGKSSEWIYARLPEGQGDGGDDGQQNGGGAGDPLGEVRDAPKPSSGGESSEGDQSGEGAEEQSAQPDLNTEADWKLAVSNAAQAAQKRGRGALGAKLTADQLLKPRVDWESALRRFVQQIAAADYTWAQPNRRFMGLGVYMPTLRSEEAGEIAVAIDTSGSIDRVLLAQFAAELRAIIEDVKPTRVRVLYADARVHRVDTFERGDPLVLNPMGGGGTDFAPTFGAIAEFEDEPRCVVYLTDLYGGFPRVEPPYPVLWASTTEGLQAPFGETIYVGD